MAYVIVIRSDLPAVVQVEMQIPRISIKRGLPNDNRLPHLFPKRGGPNMDVDWLRRCTFL